MPAASGCATASPSSATVMRNRGSLPLPNAGRASAASSLAANGVRETCTTRAGCWPNFWYGKASKRSLTGCPGCTKPMALDGAYSCACSTAPCGTMVASADDGETLCPGTASTVLTVPDCGARTTRRCSASCSAASRLACARSRSRLPAAALATSGRARRSPSSSARWRKSAARWRASPCAAARRPSISSDLVCTWAAEMNCSPCKACSRASDCSARARRWRCRPASTSICASSPSSAATRRSSAVRCAPASACCVSADSARLRRRSSRLRRTCAWAPAASAGRSSASTNSTSPARTACPSTTCRSTTVAATAGTRRISPRSGTSTPLAVVLRVYCASARKAPSASAVSSTPAVTHDKAGGRTS